MASEMKFRLGQTVMTPGFVALFDGNMIVASIASAQLIARHSSGDWGELDKGDKSLNDEALTNGDRILSKYTVQNQGVYVITEWDRSATTVLLTSEY